MAGGKNKNVAKLSNCAVFFAKLGFQLAEYNLLNGKVLVNALNIADNLTARPAADKIVKNLLK